MSDFIAIDRVVGEWKSKCEFPDIYFVPPLGLVGLDLHIVCKFSKLTRGHGDAGARRNVCREVLIYPSTIWMKSDNNLYFFKITDVCEHVGSRKLAYVRKGGWPNSRGRSIPNSQSTSHTVQWGIQYIDWEFHCYVVCDWWRLALSEWFLVLCHSSHDFKLYVFVAFEIEQT